MRRIQYKGEEGPEKFLHKDYYSLAGCPCLHVFMSLAIGGLCILQIDRDRSIIVLVPDNVDPPYSLGHLSSIRDNACFNQVAHIYIEKP